DQLGNYWLVMEYADGGTLRNYLKNHFNSVTWDIKYDFAFQLSYAVSSLHDEGIVHRDLHPDNILIHQNSIKLSDFGLMKRIEEVSSKQQARFYDVIPYADPKWLKDQTYKLDFKSDVYSVGVILWEISSGRTPFYIEGETNFPGLAEKITQGIRETPIQYTPEDYVKLYTECWNNEPDHRPDMKKLVKAFLSRVEMKENDQMYDDSSSVVEISQSVQNFDQMNTKQMMETLTNKRNVVIVDDIVDIILDNGNKGIEEKKVIRHINDYSMNQMVDLQEFIHWLLRNQNRSNNIYLLGYFNHTGIGTNCDKKEAFDLFFKASNQNNILGHTYVGIYYLYENETIPINGKLTFKYFKKVADKGLTWGHSVIGYLYKHGIGVERNFKVAVYWFEKASEQGNLSATNYLGDCYKFEHGVQQDKNKAFELYKKSAEGGHQYGIANLGYCYQEGIGTEVDLVKALECYERAANDDCASAMDKLGHLYIEGLGVEKDHDKAFDYFQRSANKNYACALTNLGECYRKGYGTAEDMQKAFEYFEKGAKLNDWKAQYKLGELYGNEEGTDFDLDKAIKWYIKNVQHEEKLGEGYNGQNRLEYLIRYKLRGEIFDDED
ncbi:12961_t:CDS:2, partial [Funneliformis geosporum]